MSEEAIIKRLPKDTQICSYGKPMKIGIAMTIETVNQALALKNAIDVAIIPLLELGAEPPQTTEQKHSENV